MCGRYTLTAAPDRIAKRFGVRAGESGAIRFNVAPGQEVLAVVQEDGRRQARLLRWGLIPSWSKTEKAGYKMINARAETVAERPAYRNLMRSAKHRCLIVADGFYEWMKPEDPGEPRVPMRFSLTDGDLFAFAGLWTLRHANEADAVASCTILTTDANSLVAPVHDRMPVILDGPPAETAWLDATLDSGDVAALLRPLPSEALTVKRVSIRVGNARNEGPDLLSPD